jgi:formyl-CoA transferase
MADWLTVPLLHAEAGDPPKRIGLAHPSIAPYGVFASAEGRPILISIQSEREWRRLCAEVLERPELPDDARFATNVARVAHRAETDGIVGDCFARLPHDRLIDRLTRADIAFAEVNDMMGLARHPHLRRIAVETPAGTVSIPAPGPIVKGEARRYGPVPAIGRNKEGADKA